MSKQLQISIAMCTYNGARYLQEQLASIASQTRLPDELVICDDGSADSTLSLLSDFAINAPFNMRVEVSSQHLGSTQNFAKAISLCNGDIIVLADQDDVWSSRKLAYIDSAFVSNPKLGALFSDARLIDVAGLPLSGTLWKRVGFSRNWQNKLRNGSALDLLLIGNFVTGATLAFRADWRGLVLPIPSGWVHDYWICLLLAAASKLDFADEILINYRCHPAQQLGIRGSKRRGMAEFGSTAYLAAAQKCEEVGERLLQYDATRLDKEISKCTATAEHLRRRGNLPHQFLRRFPEIMRELFNGNYFHHSSGIKSILRDLLANS